MTYVRPKKSLGQHFLNDQNIAKKIVESLTECAQGEVLEIGPGMGVLTQYLLEKEHINTHVIEIDRDSVAYLQSHFPKLDSCIHSGDFLKLDLTRLFSADVSIIGNFPYNISSQILFRVLEYRNQIPWVVGMFQKEVAERLSSGPGGKEYGILSVLLQAYYDIEYLFTVNENVFYPPPKVKSAVIRLKRNDRKELGCDEKKFKLVVKTAFNQRRKTIRNSIKSLLPLNTENVPFLTERPERLSVENFVELTKSLG